MSQMKIGAFAGPVLLVLVVIAASWWGSDTSAQSTDGGSARSQSAPTAVSALGRIEPDRGVIRVAASSTPQSMSGSVLKTLFVEVGDFVKKGQRLAVTDSADVMSAMLAEAKTELARATSAVAAEQSKLDEACVLADVAKREADRRARLLEQKIVSAEETEQARGEAEAKAASCTAARADVRLAESEVEVARARVRRVEAELRRCSIYSPAAGRVLDVLTWPGELIAEDGILELGRVDRMFAIAEVYETDIRRVKVGQSARVSSDALAKDLGGQVHKIRPKVQKQDVIGTDPAARKDARIVEVEILLDDPEPAAGLTNLQVEVVINPSR